MLSAESLQPQPTTKIEFGKLSEVFFRKSLKSFICLSVIG